MWYQFVLELLDPRWNQLYLVSDPDGILNHPELRAQIITRGQSVSLHSDPIDLRLFYECEWRSKPPTERTPHILVCTGVPPYDLLLQAKYLTLSYEKIFPDLNPHMLRELESRELQALWLAENTEQRKVIVQAHLRQKQALTEHFQAFKQRLENVEKNSPTELSTWQTWLNFAWDWAQFRRLYTELPYPLQSTCASDWQRACRHMDTRYLNWLKKHWNSLLSLPPSPVVVHHIPHFLARWKMKHQRPVALLILDGLALDQWLLIEETLLRQFQFVLQRQAIFAWLPSLTGISRRAIFNGLMPRHHAGGAEALGREASEWYTFWHERGEKQVYYAKSFQSAQLNVLVHELEQRMNPVLGLILNTVDDMMHGNTLGNSGLYGHIKTWLEQGHLAELISRLFARGYEIFISADHGNTEATGLGPLSDGVMAESTGERVRLYSSQLLREQACQKYSRLIPFDSAGLPSDFYPLYAPERFAFAPQHRMLVVHGGPTLEETVVPWIHLSRSQL